MAGRVVLQDQASVLKGALGVKGMETQEVNFFKEQPIKGKGKALEIFRHTI